ncbi:MAG: hypothetical protein K2N55_11530, partial [Lachnospiraceae bacterium]|nr:hypothetical protein [Lachnospiraceae bacterium]
MQAGGTIKKRSRILFEGRKRRMQDWKKQKEGRRAKNGIVLRGISAFMIMAILLTSNTMTVSGRGKNKIPSQQEEISIKDRFQRYPVLSGSPDGDLEDYIMLSVTEGTGCEDKTEDPGAEERTQKTCYLERQVGSRGGFSSSACSYDMPSDWVVATTSLDTCLELIYCPQNPEAEMFVHITENRMFPDGVTEKWEEMQANIKASAKKEQGVIFSTPVFERYRREDGRELLFYSFICDTGGEKILCAAAYVPGKKYLAEFIGYSLLSKSDGELVSYFAIDEITRYMAASFTETEEEKTWAQLKYRPYLGAENWEYEDLHNPFAIAAKMYAPQEEPVCDVKEEEITFTSSEWEELIRMAVAYHNDMSNKEFREFSKRPLRTSDLIWITEVEMVESPIPGRDTVSINGISPKNATCAKYQITTLSDVAMLPNLESLSLEIGSADDYAALAECTSLKEISIASAEPLKEVNWLSKLPQLESLTLRISMFSHLNEIGYEKEDGSTFTGQSASPSGSVSQEPLEEVLAECTNLKYLSLEDFDIEMFGFIDNLPNLYAFCLYGREDDDTQKPPRGSLFD